MPLPIIAGTVRISYRGLMTSGRQWANVLHARYAGGASTPGVSDVAALDALLVRCYTGAAFGAGTSWFTKSAPGTTLIDATAYVLNGTSTPQVIAHAAVGTAGGNTLPSEVAHVVTVRTGTRGRSYRGRIYLPASTATHIDATGSLLAADVTTTLAQFTGCAAALGGPAVAPFWELGVASYLHNVFTPLSLFTMDAKCDVQRRRK